MAQILTADLRMFFFVIRVYVSRVRFEMTNGKRLVRMSTKFVSSRNLKTRYIKKCVNTLTLFLETTLRSIEMIPSILLS